MIKYLTIFTLGVLAGIAGYFIFGWNDAFGPPAEQNAVSIPVEIGGLDSKDQWLGTCHAYLTPLNGIWSNRKYAILTFVPPQTGIPSGSSQASTLDLEAKKSDLVQPIGITATDFGAGGNQVAVKFIDEGVIVNQTYSPSQQFTLSSHP